MGHRRACRRPTIPPARRPIVLLTLNEYTPEKEARQPDFAGFFPRFGFGFGLRGEEPVYDEVRNEIIRRGLRLADITVAHRVRAQG